MADKANQQYRYNNAEKHYSYLVLLITKITF
jgi:hypothetical protein